MSKKINRDSDIKKLLSSGMVKEVLSFKNDKYSEADVILLGDGKTIIKLSEQDYYSYHDCSSSARHIEIIQSEEDWSNYLKNYFPAHSLT